MKHYIFPILLFFVSAASYGQFFDDFSDGDFTNSPAWQGETDSFQVSTALMLQSKGDSTKSGELYLAIPNTMINTTTWQFLIRLDFQPSSANKARIFLVSDSLNLAGPLNGYFIQIGETGTTDSIDFFIKTGATETKLGTGISGCFSGTSTNLVRIRVSRDNSGNWDISSDCAGGYNFTTELNTTENSHASTNFFGVFCDHTSTRWDLFYFDDIYVGGPIADTIPPALDSSSVLSATQLDLFFSDDLDQITAETELNYTVNGAIGNPDLAIIDPADSSLIHLTFSTNPFANGGTYTVTVCNVEDTAGNPIAPCGTSNFFWLQAVSAVPNDIIINEIYADTNPSVGLPPVEFVELFNRSNKVFDLSGWTFKDASATTGTFPPHIFSPGEYILICSNADTALLSSYGTVIGLSMGSLNNASDQLGLRDNSGNLIDTVEYDMTWYGDAAKENGGWTFERINPDDTCGGGGSNWSASNDTNGGTPGMVNSVFDTSADTQAPGLVSISLLSDTTLQVCFDESIVPGWASVPANFSVPGIGIAQNSAAVGPSYNCVDLEFSPPFDTGTVYTLEIGGAADCAGNTAGLLSGSFAVAGGSPPGGVVFTEIFPDPDTLVTSIPDVEYIEILNSTSTAITLNGWEITDAGTGNGSNIGNETLLPGEYAVLTSTGDADEFTAWPAIRIIGVSSFLTLNNSGDNLQLFDSQGILIDQAFYTDEWHDDAGKNSGGWSIERIDATFPCMNPLNWRSSIDPSGGTPGLSNSVSGSFTDATAPEVDHVTVTDPQVISVWFDELMSFAGLDQISNYTINPGGFQPSFAAPIFPGYQQVDLLLANPLDTHVTYTIFVTNVSDCSGNPIGTDNWAEFGIPGPPDPGDVIINEILFNPLTGGSDYLELVNLSEKILDLQLLHIGEIFEGTDSVINDDQVSAGSRLFLPGKYICLTPDKAIQLTTYLPIDPDAIFEMSSFPSYDDTEGEIVILTDSGLVLDRFHYLDDYHFENLDGDDGVSLERLDFYRPTQDSSNWHSAASTVNFGTPGYRNSQQLVPDPQDGSVTLNPQVFSPDNDGIDDVLGIDYSFSFTGNNARVTIYDDRGRLILRLVENTLLGTDAGTFTWDGIDASGNKAGIGIFVILFEVSNPATGVVNRWKLSAVLAGKL